jgi:hypothetical protein
MTILLVGFVFVIVIAVIAFLVIYFVVIAPGHDAGAAHEGYDYEEDRGGYPYVNGSNLRGRSFNSGYARARSARIDEYAEMGIHYHPPGRRSARVRTDDRGVRVYRR